MFLDKKIRSHLFENALPQVLHTAFLGDCTSCPIIAWLALSVCFFVAWTFSTWFLRFAFRVKLIVHSSHGKIRSSVCWRRWQRNDALENCFLHSGQVIFVARSGAPAGELAFDECKISWYKNSDCEVVLKKWKRRKINEEKRENETFSREN